MATGLHPHPVRVNEAYELENAKRLQGSDDLELRIAEVHVIRLVAACNRNQGRWEGGRLKNSPESSLATSREEADGSEEGGNARVAKTMRAGRELGEGHCWSAAAASAAKHGAAGGRARCWDAAGSYTLCELRTRPLRSCSVAEQLCTHTVANSGTHPGRRDKGRTALHKGECDYGDWDGCDEIKEKAPTQVIDRDILHVVRINALQ